MLHPCVNPDPLIPVHPQGCSPASLICENRSLFFVSEISIKTPIERAFAGVSDLLIRPIFENYLLNSWLAGNSSGARRAFHCCATRQCGICRIGGPAIRRRAFSIMSSSCEQLREMHRSRGWKLVSVRRPRGRRYKFPHLRSGSCEAPGPAQILPPIHS